uniref:Uncharacterized protein n=1 Tax=Onchocerca volvulus TaxID=6282 RepID=A0A8R1XW72_ONCVO
SLIIGQSDWSEKSSSQEIATNPVFTADLLEFRVLQHEILLTKYDYGKKIFTFCLYYSLLTTRRNGIWNKRCKK